MSRHPRARRLVLQALCCLDVQGTEAIRPAERFISDSHEPAETLLAAREMLGRAVARRDECDRFLVRNAKHWSLPRLALIDRNILRLATYELLNGKAPYKVVISEAMHLAQEFSTAESPRFINGILDAIAREIRDRPDRTDEEAPEQA